MILIILALGLFGIIVCISNIKNSKGSYIFREEKEETFYHPTTRYKGTRSEMDAYIKNRERKLKN